MNVDIAVAEYVLLSCQAARFYFGVRPADVDYSRAACQILPHPYNIVENIGIGATAHLSCPREISLHVGYRNVRARAYSAMHYLHWHLHREMGRPAEGMEERKPQPDNSI